jgi:hypothetical protein
VTITENGRRRKITKREAVIKQLVNKSASSDARSLKILLDLMLNLEARARSSAAPPPPVGPGDEEVLAQLKARLEGRHPRRDSRPEMTPGLSRTATLAFIVLAGLVQARPGHLA